MLREGEKEDDLEVVVGDRSIRDVHTGGDFKGSENIDESMCKGVDCDIVRQVMFLMEPLSA